MARPSRTGFAKRQKEMARSEKRQLKLARRQKAKEAGGTDVEAEDGSVAASEEEQEQDPGQDQGEAASAEE